MEVDEEEPELLIFQKVCLKMKLSSSNQEIRSEREILEIFSEVFKLTGNRRSG